MNVHHLELFYFVAKHGGIMPAVRNIPYGIQQPAVSSQISQLEEFFGTALFQRRPFALTAEGEKLFQFIQPFFSNLEKMADEIRGGQTNHLRLGASAIILREHLPELLDNLRKKFSDLKISLREGHQAQLENFLLKDEIDLAITLIEKKSAPAIFSLPLLDLPLALLVEKKSKISSAQDFWRQDKIREPLIGLPASETICKNFQQGLQKIGVDWLPNIEVNSLDLLETYVARGWGVGVSVLIPKFNSPKIKIIPLPDFSPVTLGAMWRGKPNELTQAFLNELKLRAAQLKK